MTEPFSPPVSPIDTQLKEAEKVVNSGKSPRLINSPAARTSESVSLASISEKEQALSIDDPGFLNTIQENVMEIISPEDLKHLCLM